MYTELPKTCKGPALVLLLEGEAQNAALELPEDEIAQENSVDAILHQLNSLRKIPPLLSFKLWKHLKRLKDLVICLFNHS